MSMMVIRVPHPSPPTPSAGGSLAGASVRLTAPQSIPDNAPAAAGFDTEDRDDG